MSDIDVHLLVRECDVPTVIDVLGSSDLKVDYTGPFDPGLSANGADLYCWQFEGVAWAHLGIEPKLQELQVPYDKNHGDGVTFKKTTESFRVVDGEPELKMLTESETGVRIDDICIDDERLTEATATGLVILMNKPGEPQPPVCWSTQTHDALPIAPSGPTP